MSVAPKLCANFTHVQIKTQAGFFSGVGAGATHQILTVSMSDAGRTKT